MEETDALIAEFLGYTVGELEGWLSGKRPYAYKKNDMGQISEVISLTNLKYSTDWNPLMKACKKWDELHIDIKGQFQKEYKILCDDLDNCVTLYEITTVYNQLVSNLRWLRDITGS